jgi:aryl-alcohol dehydrogenase-like predicted oxidoreductase
VEQNVKAAEGELTPEELAEIDEIDEITPKH